MCVYSYNLYICGLVLAVSPLATINDGILHFIIQGFLYLFFSFILGRIEIHLISLLMMLDYITQFQLSFFDCSF